MDHSKQGHRNQRRKEFAIALVAIFATAGSSETITKLENFYASLNRLRNVLSNIERHNYADTLSFCQSIINQDNPDLSRLGFLREIAKTDPSEIETYDGEDPHDKSAPMFLRAVNDFLEKFDELPVRIQYLVVNLAPKQGDLLDSLEVTHLLKTVDLPQEAFEREIAARSVVDQGPPPPRA